MNRIITKGIEALNAQIVDLDFEIQINPKTKKSFELVLIDELGDNLYNKTYTLSSSDFIKSKQALVDFFSEISSIIEERDSDNEKLYIAFEYDQWMSTSSQDYKGVFTSRFKALLELQKHYQTIIKEESSNQFIDFAEEIEEETQFEKLQILNITINEVE